MRRHPARRTSLVQGGALLAGCLSLLLAGAAPASGGQEPGAIGYEVEWTFGGGAGAARQGAVVSTLTERSYSFVDDLTDPEQGDRAVSKPDRGQSVSIDGQGCTPGNYNTSAVTVYGAADWFNKADGTPRVRVSLLCKRLDGSLHRYRWGYAPNVNCVNVTRTAGGGAGAVGDIFSLAPSTTCPVEHVLLGKGGKETAVPGDPTSFSSDITLLSRR